MPSPHLLGTLQAVSIVTNVWAASLRFYTEGLGYSVLAEGELSEAQRRVFGASLRTYALLGHAQGSVVRLLHLADPHAQPNRMGARPWDNGLCVLEAGTRDVQRAYERILRARFGVISEPKEFDCEAPEPLGYVRMRSVAFMGPAGEQIFVTQIVDRRGGQSLLQEKAVDGINAPANVVVSLTTRTQQVWYREVLGLVPVNDLPLQQPDAAAVMGGPPEMGFAMCLMGHGTHRIGWEQHVYGDHHPHYTYQTFPSSFTQSGLASAAWQGQHLEALKKTLVAQQNPPLGTVCLPIRGQSEPQGLVFRGPVGEIIELFR